MKLSLDLELNVHDKGNTKNKKKNIIFERF